MLDNTPNVVRIFNHTYYAFIAKPGLNRNPLGTFLIFGIFIPQNYAPSLFFPFQKLYFYYIFFIFLFFLDLIFPFLFFPTDSSLRIFTTFYDGSFHQRLLRRRFSIVIIHPVLAAWRRRSASNSKHYRVFTVITHIS